MREGKGKGRRKGGGGEGVAEGGSGRVELCCLSARVEDTAWLQFGRGEWYSQVFAGALEALAVSREVRATVSAEEPHRPVDEPPRHGGRRAQRRPLLHVLCPGLRYYVVYYPVKFRETYRPRYRKSTGTRLGASSEQVVRDVNPDFRVRVFDKPASES